MCEKTFSASFVPQPAENNTLWDFDILPSPPSQTIQPRDPDTVNEELDSVLSPIHLQGQTGCNCNLQPINLQGQTGVTVIYNQ